MISFPKYRRTLRAMKRLYNRIYRFYGLIEKAIGPAIVAFVEQKVATLPDAASSTALEYACGSGLLTLRSKTAWCCRFSCDNGRGPHDRPFSGS
jgi:hypothetical protein